MSNIFISVTHPPGKYEVHGTLKTQNENFATAIGALAAISTFQEITVTPKPGLVDSCGTGAHSDMDWTLFILSACALAPYWSRQAMEGILCEERGPYPALFSRLRKRGSEMERAMCSATGGVNTHKGMIFAMSLLTGAAGLCLREGGCSPEKIRRKTSEISAPFMAEEFERIARLGRERRREELSHGEKIFLNYGVGGIRKEAMLGFPSIEPALASYENALCLGARENDAAICALLTLMSVCEDTNVIHRAGIEFWREKYIRKVEEAQRQFDPVERNYDRLLEFDEFLVKNGASPGGAADLLACTLFLYSSKMRGNKK
jgi:triphosphoribosyl-dephospho-CoA synthetase